VFDIASHSLPLSDIGCIPFQIQINLDLSDKIDLVRWKRTLQIFLVTVGVVILFLPA